MKDSLGFFWGGFVEDASKFDCDGIKMLLEGSLATARARFEDSLSD